MGIPWRLPRLKPNSQAKVGQHRGEVALQQNILAFEVPEETKSQLSHRIKTQPTLRWLIEILLPPCLSKY